VGLIYLFAAQCKAGSQWQDGTALYRVLQLTEFVRPGASWLLEHPRLLAAGTYATLGVEWAFFFLVFLPLRPCRALAVASVLALHAGIFLTMRVGLFSWLMPVTMLLFVRAEWLDLAERRLAGPLGRARAWIGRATARWRREPAAAPPVRTPRERRALAGLVALQLLLVVWTQAPYLPRGLPQLLPSVRAVATAEVQLVGLWQSWAMFAPNPFDSDGRWLAPARLTDGTRLDALAAAAPRMIKERGFFYNRWVKYRVELFTGAYPGALRMLADYLCRDFNRRHERPQLSELDLIFERTITHGPGEPPHPPTQVSAWHQRCRVSAPPATGPLR
jgi:hypothetical protein